ncbi:MULTISPECIES: hypothetical protein [Dyella]|uniref:Uncharacterized protein n=2 Tax=Dyella TaxID=231454 RepID=A0A4R0YJ31_9GAMM|nr:MULTISPECIES: hypothetical protein [Dyella]TBR36448.1 hypothetical protein EYV96_10915 [Dyella terrae]TCI08460.1 hypothetical protein EZM97_27955 [Dyella soli]
MDGRELTFALLNERIEGLPEHPSVSTKTSRREILAYVIGGVSAVLAIGLLNWPIFGKRWSIGISAVLVVIEIVSLGIALFPIVRRPRLPSFSAERRDLADQMDFDRIHHEALISWLCSYPSETLSTLASYARGRHERMKDRMPIMLGAIEKLGVLPLVGALLIQVKSYVHEAKYGWLDLLVVAALFIGYWMALALVFQRIRLEQMAIYLADAANRSAVIEGASRPGTAAHDTLVHPATAH